MKRILLLSLIAMLGIHQMQAQLNFNFGKYPTYSAELEEEASKGSPYVQVVLGRYYLEGKGVKKDYNKAVYWLRQAESTEHEDLGRVYEALGYCYEFGYGVPKNDTIAFRYYTKSYERDFVYSYVDLGWCYLNGIGTDVNFDEAEKLFKKALEVKWVDTGYRKAKLSLGYIYAYVRNDVVKGLEYLTEAGKDGSGMALFHIANIYDNGVGGVKADPAKAVYYLQESIYNETYPFVLTKLANHYYEGNGVQKDVDKAIDLYKDAARMGDEAAKEKLKEIGHS